MSERHPFLMRVAVIAVLACAKGSLAAWGGLVDQSTALQTSRFDFGGTSNPEAGDSNENYYDGDFGDIDGDGRVDRALVSRYGLLLNTGGGLMTPLARSLNQYRFGDADGIGNDAVQLVDVDGDGDLDSVQGGNGEALTLQINRKGRFSIKWKKTSDSALNIISIDLEKDGDVDLVVAHAYCGRPDNCGCGAPNCGGPVDFGLYVNDGQGNFTEESTARGLPFSDAEIVQPIAGDIDNDGDFDLVFGRGDTGQLAVAKNNGSGVFTVTNLNLLPPPGGFTQGAHLADIDDDGDLDIMLGNEFPGGVSQAIAHKIYINDGLGSFTDESALRFVVGTASDLWGEHSEVLDIDYDGDLDFVVLRKSTTKDIQVYLNNGAGVFSLGTAYSFTLPGAGSAFGADLDVSDIDGDGSYDLWAGLAGEKVRPLINSYRRPDGTPADAPQAFRVVTTSSGTVTLAWRVPDFAATNRSYRVYRSTTSELGRSDQTLLKVIALSRHEDEGFFAPITRFTTTSRLADAQVTLNGAMNEVEFRDTTAVPGVKYQYWVAHVGTEHTESVHVGPLEASGGAGASGADTQAPQLDIVGPTRDEFSVYPRIVLTYGDGQSGIDVASLRISFNQALTGSSPRAANADVSDLFFRKDAQAFVSVLGPMLSLPASTLVTMTVSIDDAAGNRATRTVQFVTGAAPGNLPVAVAAVSPLNGTAVMVSNCSGAASTDSDGKIVSWEWAFGDGSTLNGRVVDKTWTRAGTFAVTLVVRDNEGGVGVAQQMVTVAANPDAGAGSGGADAGSADAGSADAGSSDAGSADAGPGVGGVDAGGVFDAGLLDAGYKNDAGNVDGGRSGDAGQDFDGGVGSCGCGSLDGVGWAGALGLIVALRRRRPRTKKI